MIQLYLYERSMIGNTWSLAVSFCRGIGLLALHQYVHIFLLSICGYIEGINSTFHNHHFHNIEVKSKFNYSYPTSNLYVNHIISKNILNMISGLTLTVKVWPPLWLGIQVFPQTHLLGPFRLARRAVLYSAHARVYND